MRESAKRSRHEADVVRAGGHFVPLVYDTYGTMGEGAEAWFRGLVAVAPIEPPEWMAASGASSEDIEEWESPEGACILYPALYPHPKLRLYPVCIPIQIGLYQLYPACIPI